MSCETPIRVGIRRLLRWEDQFTTMSNTLELFLLDSGGTKHAVALGRCNGDVAIEKIPLDKECQELVKYRDTLDGVVLGTADRPTTKALREFGERVFKWLFRGELRALYGYVPHGPVSVQILSNRSELKELPWEYMQAPDRQPAPHRERCVVRVLPTCGIPAPAPLKLKDKIRVLFVSADPIDQTDVPWDEVRASIERAYKSQLPDAVEMKVIEGATRERLRKAVQQETFEIFHFFGHGVIRNNEGHLVLVDLKTQKSDYMSASQLASLLSGKGVRVALLSACLTGAGNAGDDFSVVATALLRAGVPAVIANQVSIPTKSVASFVGAIYAKLLQSGNIDQAVMEGRVQLAADLEGTTGANAVVEWGIPTLYRLAGSSQLFI